MVFSIDFDGTVVTHQSKGVGTDIGAAPVLRKLVENGHQLILCTMRSNRDNGLRDAVEWFQHNRILLYGIQTNPTQKDWTDSNKVWADVIIDDTAWNIPLKLDKALSDRPFIDWQVLLKQFIDQDIIRSKINYF